MADYGITATGFKKKTLAIIQAELEASYRTKFGNSINVNPPSNIGVQIGIAAEREAKIWDIAEEDFNSRAASTAQGVSLDNAGELTAVERIAAKPSTILDQFLFGDVATIVPTSLVLSVNGNPAATFSPANAVTLAAGTDAVQKLAFSLVPTSGTWTITLPDGQTTAALAFNAVASAVQVAVRLLAGWSTITVSGNYTAGFTFTFTGSTIGLQPWAAMLGTSSLLATATPVVITQSDTTVGVAQGVAKMVSTSTGPIVADAGTLTVINTPVTGLTRTFNKSDAILGADVETDAAYRIRRDNELQKTGASTIEAMRTAMKEDVPDVLECIIYQNDTDVTDGSGRPPHSLQFYVQGGTDAAVAQQIWVTIGGGIQTVGTVEVDILDSQGLTQVIKFSRPSQKNVYVIVDLTTDPSVFTDSTGSRTKDAIVAFGASLNIGDDVLVFPKLLPAIASAIAGITDMDVKVSFSPSPTLSANLSIAANEIANFDTSRITVNIT